MWPFGEDIDILSGDLLADLKAILGDMRPTEEVFLVSPYIKFDANVRRAIKAAAENDVKIHLLLRRGVDRPIEDSVFLAESGVKVRETENLHAKVYWCKHVAIVTSMNLHEFSDRNNIEVSVYFGSKRRIKEVKGLIDVWWNAATPLSVVELASSKHASNTINNIGAVCIQCKDAIDRNKAKPMCLKCFRDWENAGKNRVRPEKFCHYCGKQRVTTINQPLCDSCLQATNSY